MGRQNALGKAFVSKLGSESALTYKYLKTQLRNIPVKMFPNSEDMEGLFDPPHQFNSRNFFRWG